MRRRLNAVPEPVWAACPDAANAMRVSKRQFAALVEEAMSRIPPRFAPYLKNVIVEVQPAPSPQACDDLEIDDPRDLLGLYEGTPLTERNIETNPLMPDRIIIFQDSIQQLCRTKKQIIEQVRTTVLHEVGHHFGLDEDELTELGYE